MTAVGSVCARPWHRLVVTTEPLSRGLLGGLGETMPKNGALLSCRNGGASVPWRPRGWRMGFGRGGEGQAVNCHPRPGVSPPASVCVLMVCVRRGGGSLGLVPLSSAPGAGCRATCPEPWFSSLLPMCGPEAMSRASWGVLPLVPGRKHLCSPQVAPGGLEDEAGGRLWHWAGAGLLRTSDLTRH